MKLISIGRRNDRLVKLQNEGRKKDEKGIFFLRNSRIV